ncbi:MAG: alpha amylase C-terminal domain-containing protein, partial [Clostridia bacterium]|nr:alpha amylase C-terminal domain-containing protein [Clostridia bacterium]
AFMGYMMTFPGKKLIFMGTEYAPFREWDYKNELEWFMLKYPNHSAIKRYVKELNHLYLSSPELWEIDDSWEGFQWIEADQSELNVISYRRIDMQGNEYIVVINFSPEKRAHYTLRVPEEGSYEEIFTSDAERFGGNGTKNGTLRAKTLETEGELRAALDIVLPPYGALVFRKKPAVSVKNKNKGLSLNKEKK